MPGRQARILSDEQIKQLLTFAARSQNHRRNGVLVLLRLKAGRTARKIAKLSCPILVDPAGRLGTTSEFRDRDAKMRGGRRILRQPRTAASLEAWQRATADYGAEIKSERSGPMTLVSIVNRFALACPAPGFEGCSSHTGWRTFTIRAVKLIHQVGGLIRDVQPPAGHRSIVTPRRYNDARRKLASMI
jgi:integrase/recombinase XerD